MNYEESVRFFDHIPYFGADSSNDNLIKTLERLGHPECTLKFFHVAGTNGKGSVCAFLDSILRKGGYKTALFTSPHLSKINERIKVDGRDISDQDFSDYLERVQRVVVEPLSFFEYLFLMAILYFVDQQVDYCILETGLGGTYDSTNVVIPEISVITSIGLDHTKILGDTLEQIAKEKAGIIKSGKPIIYMMQEPSVNQVIEEKAHQKCAKIIRLSKDDIKIIENQEKSIAFSFESGYYRYNHLKISTIAEFQTWNAMLAVHAVKEIVPDLSEENIRTGLAAMSWPARMEEIEPHIILDGAHNPHAICAWSDIIKTQFANTKKDLLFAVVADKDYETMIREICSADTFGHIMITTIPGNRKADSLQIKRQFEKYTKAEITIEEDVYKAYKQAKLKREDYLFCLGSLYLAGMIKRLIV